MQDVGGEYSSPRATVDLIVWKIRRVARTLPSWAQRHVIDTGLRDGVTTAEKHWVRGLERECKELPRANEILELASTFFRRGGARPPSSPRNSIGWHRDTFGVE